jgi:hypothetical protein
VAKLRKKQKPILGRGAIQYFELLLSPTNNLVGAVFIFELIIVMRGVLNGHILYIIEINLRIKFVYTDNLLNCSTISLVGYSTLLITTFYLLILLQPAEICVF